MAATTHATARARLRLTEGGAQPRHTASRHALERAVTSGTVLPADIRPELIVAVLRGSEDRPC